MNQRFPVHTTRTAPEESRSQLERVGQAFGMIPNARARRDCFDFPRAGSTRLVAIEADVDPGDPFEIHMQKVKRPRDFNEFHIRNGGGLKERDDTQSRSSLRAS